MIQKKIPIVNRLGLHARAAAKLVHLAGHYASDITVVQQGETVDAKSILGLLQLGAPVGSEVTLRCEGRDEAAAIDAISQLFSDRFGEDS